MNSNSAWCVCRCAVDLPQQCNLYSTDKCLVGSENEWSYNPTRIDIYTVQLCYAVFPFSWA